MKTNTQPIASIVSQWSFYPSILKETVPPFKNIITSLIQIWNDLVEESIQPSWVSVGN